MLLIMFCYNRKSVRKKKIMLKKKYSALNLFIRSSIFSVFSLTMIIFCSLLVTLAIVFPLRWRFKLVAICLYIYLRGLKFICHIDYKIEGAENFGKHTGVVLSKHQSTWETFFLPTLFNNMPGIILKRELMWIPFFGWALYASDPIAIKRGDKHSSMQQIISKGK